MGGGQLVLNGGHSNQLTEQSICCPDRRNCEEARPSVVDAAVQCNVVWRSDHKQRQVESVVVEFGRLEPQETALDSTVV